MYRSWGVPRAVTATVVLVLLGTIAIATCTAWGQASGGVRQAGCAAVGAYPVGPRILPLGARGSQRPARTPRSGSARSRSAIVWYPTVLRGTLDIAAYTGCGGATATTTATTAGSFSVQSVAMGPVPAQPRKGDRGSTAIACRVTLPCWAPSGVISATGTFAQDPAHPTDPAYVLVSGTVTTARPGPQMGRPCSQQDGCPPPVVITSTVAFTGVTGYLQVAGDGQMATLSVLPPPAAGNVTIAPTALVLVGQRGVAPTAVAPAGTVVAGTAVAATAVAGTAVPVTVVARPRTPPNAGTALPPTFTTANTGGTVAVTVPLAPLSASELQARPIQHRSHQTR